MRRGNTDRERDGCGRLFVDPEECGERSVVACEVVLVVGKHVLAVSVFQGKFQVERGGHDEGVVGGAAVIIEGNFISSPLVRSGFIRSEEVVSDRAVVLRPVANSAVPSASAIVDVLLLPRHNGEGGHAPRVVARTWAQLQLLHGLVCIC